MKRTHVLTVTVAGTIALLAGFAVAQERHRAQARSGPWRVMISKPLVGLGHPAGELFREYEYLSAMLNQLDQDDLIPVMTQVMTQRTPGSADEQRLLVMCRQR
jgi:hypothetical protein